MIKRPVLLCCVVCSINIGDSDLAGWRREISSLGLVTPPQPPAPPAPTKTEQLPAGGVRPVMLTSYS